MQWRRFGWGRGPPSRAGAALGRSWGCLRLGEPAAAGNLGACRSASFIKRSEDAGASHYQSLHVGVEFNFAIVFT